MPNTETPAKTAHLRVTAPAAWVSRFTPLVKAGPVLDVACGNGRHGRLFLGRGHCVTFVDRAVEPVADLGNDAAATVIQADLETGAPWPFAAAQFTGIVVTNYLYRPLFPALIDSLCGGGVLIYETFARGNEDFNRPRNPDHLLKSGELLDAVRGRLQIVAYEHGIQPEGPLPGVVQRLCAIKDLMVSTRDDGEPPVHRLAPDQGPS